MESKFYERFLREQIDNIMNSLQYVAKSHPDPYIQSMISEIVIQHMEDRTKFMNDPEKYFKEE
jgi:hypothetical protein